MERFGDPSDLIGALLWLVSDPAAGFVTGVVVPVSYTHLRAHETPEHLVCRLLLEKKNTVSIPSYSHP